LVPFNRKNGDDLMNLSQKKDTKKPADETDPITGVEPPTTAPVVE
jgi:hypothetical protein